VKPWLIHQRYIQTCTKKRRVVVMVGGTQTLDSSTCIPTSLSITGVPVVPFESYDQALESIEEIVESKRKSFWVAINPIKIYHAWHDPRLLDLLRRIDVGICDGVGVSIASRILRGRSIRRITGCDLFFRLLALAARKGWGVFMLGASPESNGGAREKLEQMFPGLRIVGSRDGFFEDSQGVIEQINSSGADLLFVAMGSPRQEYWISRHRQAIDASFCMGVGGSFDVAAGNIRRAPWLFRVTGTEFLFRFAVEPRKRLSHQKTLLYFLLQVIGKRFSGAGASVEWA
jgi:N-acetylglucosaminyldiphosphoundecaprenol N-acetyl-beta-D-mannosaminyltransferase